MRISRLLGVAFVAAAVFVGCNKSETGGGAGTDTFKVVVLAMSTGVKQGEVQTVRISVDRGTGFKQSVNLAMTAPAGLDVDPLSTTIKLGDKGDVQLKITAAKDAPLGDQKIMVRGTPDQGEPTEVAFKVTVSAK